MIFFLVLTGFNSCLTFQYFDPYHLVNHTNLLWVSKCYSNLSWKKENGEKSHKYHKMVIQKLTPITYDPKCR